MRLTQKRIEDVVTYLGGEDLYKIVKKLQGKEQVSEIKLSEQLKFDIKIIRSLLYKLYENSLISFTRKKDKKKGWYIYFWTFKPNQIKYLYKKIRKEKLEELREKISREKSIQFYLCPNHCLRVDFDNAYDLKFHCPECGELILIEDNKKKIEKIKKTIEKLEKEIK